MTTLTTPRGTKIRSASQRRYVLVYESVDPSGKVVASGIDKRSDSIETLRTYLGRKGVSYSAVTAYTIIDQRTGEVVPT